MGHNAFTPAGIGRRGGPVPECARLKTKKPVSGLHEDDGGETGI